MMNRQRCAVFFSLLLFARVAIAATCETRLRAIFDVGSGTTKLTLSEVEVCPDHTTLKRFLDDESSVAVSLEAFKVDGSISARGVTELTQALKTLKEKALAEAARLAPNVRQIEFAAVGTHAVRTAENQAALNQAVDKIGVPLNALTQTEEATVGFNGVRLHGAPSSCGKRRLLVWDVGGGSMQWTLAAAGDLAAVPRIEGLPLGAEGFKQMLMTSLNRHANSKCAPSSESPNPIGTAHIARAESLAVKAASALPTDLTKLKANDICVVGIGGVHNGAIEARINKNYDALKSCACEAGQSCHHSPLAYNKRELDCLAARFSEHDDCDPAIKGPYSSTSVSNLFLISGFLRALHLNEVNVLNVNAGHGLAADRSRLNFQMMTIPISEANANGGLSGARQ